MTLRLRLVLGLVALLTAGLSFFGVATYSFYARSQFTQLDQQVEGSQSVVATQLAEMAGGTGGGPAAGDPHPEGDRGGRQPAGGPHLVVPPGTYAQLRSADGIVASIGFATTASTPNLPAALSAGAQPRLLTVGGTGGGQYRVLVTPTQVRGVPETLVVAVPMTGVTSALHRLVVIEVIAALALLAALTSGSWLILRRGLHPLEEMASTARTITAGDLTQRVVAGRATTEVGELGLALNSMLDDIQAAFEERDATERRLRQFLSDASHELRTPLTSIQGFAELFRVSGDRARVDLPTILRRIEQESGRMRVLVEDLLLLARLDETRPAEVAPVDLAVLAADACSDAIAAAPDRCVRLDAPTPVLVDGDESHLRQAVANLVTNAIKHTGAGGQIEVRAWRHAGVARITVSDRGPGLTDAALQHVFDRFWQEDSARVGTGAGLGLAIVSSVAAEHGGRAAAANREGGGAAFTVELPMRRSPGAGAGLVAA